MINGSKEFYIPQGVLSVNTGKGIIDEIRKGDSLSIQETYSNKILVENAFFLKRVDNWGISAKFPTSQYSEPSIMTVASPIFKENEDSKNTFLIYDAPSTVQEEYWKMTLKLLNNISDITKKEDHPLKDSMVFLTGHHCRHKQDIGYPSARSVMAHHDHIIITPTKLPGETYQATDFGLPEEVNLLTDEKNIELPYYLPNFVSFIEETFPQKISISICDQKPVGYSFNVENNSDVLTDVLNKHFKSYKGAMEASEYLERSILDENVSINLSKNIKYDAKKGKVIQPSFVLYLIPNNDKIKVIISPMLVGIGGPERAGIELKKGPDYPRRFDDKLYKKVVDDIKTIF